MTMRTYVTYHLDVTVPIDLRDAVEIARLVEAMNGIQRYANQLVDQHLPVTAEISDNPPRIVRRRVDEPKPPLRDLAAQVASMGADSLLPPAPVTGSAGADLTLTETVAAIRAMPWNGPAVSMEELRHGEAPFDPVRDMPSELDRTRKP